MGKDNLVSIVIATYNRANLIGETLDGLKAQTYSNWECIVVDDGSLDNTELVVSDFIKYDRRIKFFHRPKTVPKGPNGARNYGIKQSQGEYIISLDSDDFLLPNHLEVKMTAFNENPSLEGVLSKTIMINDNKEEIKREHRTMLSDNLIEDFITLNISWYMHDIMWKRSFFNNKMLYNEELLKWLDRDFHIRRLIEKPNLFLVDQYLSLYRIHNDSNSSNSNYKVLETRHFAVISILDLLEDKKLLSNKIKLFFLIFQIQNLVVLYKSPKVLSMYFCLIKKTFLLNKVYIKWLIKLCIGFVVYKITGKGLKIIQ